MKRPSGNMLLQFQVGLLLALGLVWWVTRPTENPETRNEFGPSPEIVWGDGQNEVRQSTPPNEPPWMSSIDTGKPECAALKEELLIMLARGESTDVLYLGDCHKPTAVYQIVR